jgi:hypothetical protein
VSAYNLVIVRYILKSFSSIMLSFTSCLRYDMKEVNMYLLSKWYLQQQVVRSFRRAGLMKYGLHFSNVRCDTLTPG